MNNTETDLLNEKNGKLKRRQSFRKEVKTYLYTRKAKS